MTKRILLACLLVAVLLVAGFGCGQGGTGGDSDEFDITKVPQEDLKVAILIPSSPTDGGWGQVGAEGMKHVAKELGIEPVIIEAATADLMKTEAEALAADGFHVVFGHGGQYAAPFDEIAGSYPNTLFITMGGNIIKDNLMPMDMKNEEPHYIQGVLAAHITKTNKLGVVIGGEFPAYTKTSRAFELGAKSVNPNIEVMVGVTQDASDMNEGYELTMAQIQAGADIVMANANQAGQGSVNAAKETNTYIFGSISDISGEAPDQTIATGTTNYGPAMLSIVKNYTSGELEPGIIPVGFPEGAVGWVWNEKVKAQLPQEIIDLYQETLDKILSGEIDVPGEREGW
jgi:basic membrane protein A